MMLLSFSINCLIVLLVVFSIYAMFTGWNFMSKHGAMDPFGVEMFRYYTIDSNILVAVCSFIMAVTEGRVLFGFLAEIPSAVYIIKLMGTSSVMLTFLVTAFFLVPQFENPKYLYYNSNLFLHAIVPLLALLSFLFFEKTELPFYTTLYAVLPTVVYAVYYVTEIYRHLKDDEVDKYYDFYNFTGGKKKMLPIAAVVVILIAYLIGAVIWFLN